MNQKIHNTLTNRWRSRAFRFAGMSALLTVVALTSRGETASVDVTVSNFKRVTARPTLLYGYHPCGNGKQRFLSAFADLQGVQLAAISSYKDSFVGSKPSSFGYLLLFNRGKVVASAGSDTTGGANLMRAWAHKALAASGIPHKMKATAPNRARPLPNQTRGVNLKAKLLADLPLRTASAPVRATHGANLAFGYSKRSGHFSFREDSFYGNGDYFNEKRGYGYVRASKASTVRKLQAQGFAIHFNYRPIKLKKYYDHLGSAIGEMIYMTLTTEGHLKFYLSARGGGKSVQDVYILKETQMKPGAWHSIVLSVRPENRRISVAVDGYRLKDLVLTESFARLFRQKSTTSLYSFYNGPRGKLLRGYLSDLKFFHHPLNGEEMFALYRLHNRQQDLQPLNFRSGSRSLESIQRKNDW